MRVLQALFPRYIIPKMESHPIPQNVTSFEFHLIGDMTLKQFCYLATGLGIAYLTFILIFPASKLIALPMIIISVFTGATFAFVPIQDRPLDHWLISFLKAVYSPTQMRWQPAGIQQDINLQSPIFRNRLHIYLSVPNTQVTPVPTKLSLVPTLLPAGTGLAGSPPQLSPQSLPSDNELHQTIELAKQAQLIQTKIVVAEKQINEMKSAPDTNQIQQLVQNLQLLIKQAQDISQRLSALSPQPATLPKIAPLIPIKVVEMPKAKSTQVQMTSSPNVINGVVTDSVGNYLEGVIIIIHNRDGLPVRALKTNKLGQFTGATPLASGIYTVILEKDNLGFDSLEVTLNDQVLPPLLISAKKGV